MSSQVDEETGSFVVFAESGTAMGCSTWSEVDVRAWATGRGGNSVSMDVDVSSRPVSRFFLRGSDGQEIALTLNGSFAVRDGHTLTATFANKRAWMGDAGGNLIMLYNHHTDTEYIHWGGLEDTRGHRESTPLTIMVALIAMCLWIYGDFRTALCAFFISLVALFGAREIYIKKADTQLLARSRQMIRQQRKVFQRHSRQAPIYDSEPVWQS